MNIKQLSLIALLATPALSQAAFPQDELIYNGSLATLIASPFMAYWTLQKAKEHVQAREKIEATVTGLPERLETLRNEAIAEEEKNPDWLFRVNKPAVYSEMIGTDSPLYKKLVHHLTLSGRYLAAFIASIAAGGFSYQMVQKYKALDLP